MPMSNLKPLLTTEQLHQRIGEMATEISAEYRDKNPLVVGILKGAVPFLVHLSEALSIDAELDYMCVSSYAGERASSGEVKMVLDLGRSIENRHVLLVEDIVDTGLTIHYLTKILSTRQPASIKVATLLHKPAKTTEEASIDFCGFSIDDHFVVGYGLDYNERFRNLPYVAILPPE